MAHESFEDQEVADYLNQHFISIKVDREERPDVDHIYMTVCQALTGHGGWPLTVFLTPERQPFFAGTYFPKHDRGPHPGFLRLLALIQQKWVYERQDLLDSASAIGQDLSQAALKSSQGVLDSEILTQAYELFVQSFDAKYGGFGRAPKFPSSHQLLFLMAYGAQGEQALPMALKTLTKLRQGGIYDQLGFGFSRYSVDQEWKIPHFEKMLYDNAMLLWAYAKAYEVTGQEEFAQTAREIVAYVTRDMMSPEGAFYSAEDADSEGVEGKFYVWTYEEVQTLLGDQAQIFSKFYDVTKAGNFEEGLNVLRQIQNPAQTADLNRKELEQTLEQSRKILFQAREQRVRPQRDDKILYSWNALWISTLASAGRILHESAWIKQAEQGMAFLEEHLVDSSGRLLARYREGEAAYPAYLDDYAYGLWAYITLYQATWQGKYLLKATGQAQALKALFYDAKQGGFYFTGQDQEVLLYRAKEFYDSALPSGNSIALLSLVELYRLTQDAQWLAMAEETFKAAAVDVKRYPAGYAMLLTAWHRYLQEPQQLIIVEKGHEDLARWNAAFNEAFKRGLTILAWTLDDEKAKQAFSHLDEAYAAQPGRAFYCEHYACQAPVTSPEEVLKQIKG